MTKVKFNVKGVESGGNRKLMKNALYEVKIVEAPIGQGGKNNEKRIELKTEVIEKGEYLGQRLRTDYINIESEDAAWKFRQFLEGVGLVVDGKETGTLDTDKLVGKVITVRVKGRNDEQYGVQNDIAQYISPDDEEPDDDEPDPEEEEAAEEPDTDEESDDSEEDEDWTEEELSELDDDDLKLYAFGGADEDGDEIEALVDGDASDYETKKKKGKKTVTTLDREKLIAAMIEAQGGDDDEDGDEEPADYDSMELAELRELAKSRGLSTKGAKGILVKRLQKDDEPF
jgi:hypothetical protein